MCLKDGVNNMIKLVMVIFLLSPGAVLAQQGMDQEIMQQLQEMVTCMAAIDENEMKELEKESKNFEAVVEGLCKSGNRDKAQELALEFSKKVVNSPALISMRKCTEKISESMKGMAPNMDPGEIAKDYRKDHVCNQI